jgi:hypothetical protein
MAQTTSSSGSRARRSSSSRNRTTSRNGSSQTTKSSRTNRSRNSTRGRNGSSQTSTTKVAELAAKAKPQAEKVKRTGKMTGERVTEFASKAKTPLVAGGAALAGIAGGLALKSRTESKRPTKRFRAVQLPKSLKNVDLDQLIEAGRRVRSIGEQVGDVADTADKTHKKHK